MSRIITEFNLYSKRFASDSADKKSSIILTTTTKNVVERRKKQDQGDPGQSPGFRFRFLSPS